MEEREKELVETIAKLEQDKANVVNELVSQRERARKAEEEAQKTREELEKKAADANLNNTDPEEVVNRILRQKEEESIKGSYEDALKEFKNSHNEFSDSTDTAGLVFDKFKGEIAKFNLSGLRTKEEIKQRLTEIYEFSNRKKSDDKVNFYNGTRQSGSDAKITDNAGLSNAESKLLNDMGWDKERFLKIKEKRPTYIASLLKYQNL